MEVQVVPPVQCNLQCNTVIQQMYTYIVLRKFIHNNCVEFVCNLYIYMHWRLYNIHIVSNNLKYWQRFTSMMGKLTSVTIIVVLLG